MLSNKLKVLVYIILLFLVFNFLFPIYAYAIDEDSVYVWSNGSTVSTSNSPTVENNEENNNQNTTR